MFKIVALSPSTEDVALSAVHSLFGQFIPEARICFGAAFFAGMDPNFSIKRVLEDHFLLKQIVCTQLTYADAHHNGTFPTDTFLKSEELKDLSGHRHWLEIQEAYYIDNFPNFLAPSETGSFMILFFGEQGHALTAIQEADNYRLYNSATDKWDIFPTIQEADQWLFEYSKKREQDSFIRIKICKYD